MFYKLDNRIRKYEEYTLILPSVSVGNVGQLTTDLLISTLWLSRIGYIYDEAILPLVGNDPFAHPDATTCKLTTSCEVYESTANKVIVIQQRAPFVKGKAASFLDKLIAWAEESNFRQIVLLSSSHAHERIDSQITGSQLRYLPTPATSSETTDFLRNTLRWRQLELRAPELSAPDGVYIPGGGRTAQFYRLCEDHQIPLVVLLIFCSEGDNIAEALSLATALNDWLNLIDFKAPIKNDEKSRHAPKCWKIPSSWRLTFGNSVDCTLFS